MQVIERLGTTRSAGPNAGRDTEADLVDGAIEFMALAREHEAVEIVKAEMLTVV